MIFDLNPLWGFLPLLLYIVLMLRGKDMNVSVLLCVILGAILNGESILGFANTIYKSLGSFCALIGFIIVLGSGLAEILSQTKVAHNLVYTVVNRFKLKSKRAAILISMATSTLMVSIIVGLVGGLAFKESLTTMIQGGSKMFWMFFMFVLFDPFLNYVSASGAFDAITKLMEPLIATGGEVAFMMIASAIGVFGISGTGVAQAQIIHELFLPMVNAMRMDMYTWALIVLVGCQVTFFVTPTVDMVGQMGLARSKNIKAMLANGWVLTIITFAYVLVRAIIYVS